MLETPETPETPGNTVLGKRTADSANLPPPPALRATPDSAELDSANLPPPPASHVTPDRIDAAIGEQIDACCQTMLWNLQAGIHPSTGWLATIVNHLCIIHSLELTPFRFEKAFIQGILTATTSVGLSLRVRALLACYQASPPDQVVLFHEVLADFSLHQAKADQLKELADDPDALMAVSVAIIRRKGLSWEDLKKIWLAVSSIDVLKIIKRIFVRALREADPEFIMACINACVPGYTFNYRVPDGPLISVHIAIFTVTHLMEYTREDTSTRDIVLKKLLECSLSILSWFPAVLPFYDNNPSLLVSKLRDLIPESQHRVLIVDRLLGGIKDQASLDLQADSILLALLNNIDPTMVLASLVRHEIRFSLSTGIIRLLDDETRYKILNSAGRIGYPLMPVSDSGQTAPAPSTQQPIATTRLLLRHSEPSPSLFEVIYQQWASNKTNENEQLLIGYLSRGNGSIACMLNLQIDTCEEIFQLARAARRGVSDIMIFEALPKKSINSALIAPLFRYFKNIHQDILFINIAMSKFQEESFFVLLKTLLDTINDDEIERDIERYIQAILLTDFFLHRTVQTGALFAFALQSICNASQLTEFSKLLGVGEGDGAWTHEALIEFSLRHSKKDVVKMINTVMPNKNVDDPATQKNLILIAQRLLDFQMNAHIKALITYLLTLRIDRKTVRKKPVFLFMKLISLAGKAQLQSIAGLFSLESAQLFEQHVCRYPKEWVTPEASEYFLNCLRQIGSRSEAAAGALPLDLSGSSGSRVCAGGNGAAFFGAPSPAGAGQDFLLGPGSPAGFSLLGGDPVSPLCGDELGALLSGAGCLPQLPQGAPEAAASSTSSPASLR